MFLKVLTHNLSKSSTAQTAVASHTLLALRACAFSRADILKSLDKTKVSRKQFIKKELTENPEFFKAFPHLQGIFDQNEEPENKKKQDRVSYKEDMVLNFKENKQEEPYFETLL